MLKDSNPNSEKATLSKKGDIKSSVHSLRIVEQKLCLTIFMDEFPECSLLHHGL